MMVDKKVKKIEEQIEELSIEIDILSEELDIINKNAVLQPYPKNNIEMVGSYIDFEHKQQLVLTIKSLKLKQEILYRDINLIYYKNQLKELLYYERECT